MFTELQDGEEIDAVNAAALTMKCLQVASGALYTSPDNKAYRVVHNEKKNRGSGVNYRGRRRGLRYSLLPVCIRCKADPGVN